MVILYAVMIVISGTSILAQQISCAKCGRYIREGQYIQVGSQYFHEEHFVCANCGRSIGTGQYFTQDGRFYDKRCYIDVFSLKCAWCGRPIEGQYTIKDGRNYHRDCFMVNVAPKCGWCGEVISDSSIVSSGKTYHNRCYFDHVALRCLLCDGIIEGEYMTSFRGGAWHKWHQGKVPECDMCAGFIDESKTGTFREFADDRYLCALCGESAITDVDDIEALADSLAPFLAGLGMVITTENLTFQLADKSEMAELGNRDRRDQRGYTDFRQYSTLFGLVKEQRLTVTLLDGMPRMECLKVLAHELTHVWLFTVGRTKTAPQLCEGSCNYVSLLVLQQHPGEGSRFLIGKLDQDTDPVYGDGYRKVKGWVEEVGIARWVEYLRTQDRNPW
jgi:hypothetical protein